VDADPTADARLLSDLADRSLRWTPFVGLWPPDGLMLDITGAAHLFGGEAALLADVVDRFEAHGFDATAAIGDTPGAAAALALCGRSAIVPPDATAEALRPLPVAALRIPSETTAALRRVGIARIDDLMALPRAPLAARFGASLLTRLDQALGTLAEAIAPRVPVPSHVAERRLAEPITRAEDVATVIAVLARDISGRLEARGEGARRLTLALWHTDGRIARVEVGTGSPVRNPERLARLFREKLEGDGCELETGGGYDLMRLAVTLAEPLDPEAPTLDAGARPDPGAVAALADQLGARFGADRLRRAVLVDSHVPERAALLLAGAARPSPPQARVGLEQDSRGALRPIRLLVPPEPVETIAAVPDGPPMQFRWRRVAHRVVRSEGPERIAMEWWRTGDATPPTRDYFRVEDQQGRRFWLYREGLYGRETETPRWFVHGLFA
jgi:protein ImuB